jgi:hypothetical protein
VSSQYASSRTLLAVFALAPDPAVGAHAFAAAVAAEAPDAVMLADAVAGTVLGGPHSISDIRRPEQIIRAVCCVALG